MEILGIGLPEMAFVLLIALILLGPKEMLQASRTIGRALRKFVTSPTWQAMRTTGKELQQLPTKMMRESGLEELEQMGKEVQGMGKDVEKAAHIDPRAVSVSFDEKKIFAELDSPAPVPGKTEGPAPVKQADSSSIPVPAPAKPAVSSPAEPPTPNNPQA